jgi:predicted glutamine amidotransferase
MCEINFIYSLNRPIGANETGKLVSMLAESSATNTDGFGVFNSAGQVFKSPEVFDTSKHMEGVVAVANGSDFVVAHSRAATQGAVAYQNTHPFKVNSFLFCHNGILYNDDKLRKKFHITDKVKTDSVTIGHIIHSYNQKTKDIPRAIAESAKHLSGFHSVFLYDLSTKTLYYFRHNANFTFRLAKFTNNLTSQCNHAGQKTDDNHCIIGSTDKDNGKGMTQGNMYGFPIGASYISTIEPEEDTLYEINHEGIHEIADLKFPDYNFIAGNRKVSSAGIWDSPDTYSPNTYSHADAVYDQDYKYENGIHWVSTKSIKSSKTNKTNKTNKTTESKSTEAKNTEDKNRKAMDIITQFYPSLIYQTAGKFIRVENSDDFIRVFQERFRKVKYLPQTSNFVGYIKPKHLRKISKNLTSQHNHTGQKTANHLTTQPPCTSGAKLVHKYN